MQSFLYLAGGVSVLAIATFACGALYRLGRALRALEGTLMTADEALREVVPEVRDGLGNVNDITAGVNVALRTAGVGATGLSRAATRSSQRATATLYGVRVAAGSLWRTLSHPVIGGNSLPADGRGEPGLQTASTPEGGQPNAKRR